MGLALDEPRETDLLVAQDGARIYLDKMVGEWFEGAELGWETDQWGSGFTFNHPNMSSC